MKNSSNLKWMVIRHRRSTGPIPLTLAHNPRRIDLTMIEAPPIAILHNTVTDGAPEDVLDSLRQAQWIKEILHNQAARVELVPFSLASIAHLAASDSHERPLVFNLVDSAPGEETLAYLVPGLLRHFGLRHTGCSLDALYTTTNKLLAKHLLRSHSVATPDWLRCGETFDPKAFERGATYIVKPIAEDASVGLDDDSLVVAQHPDAVYAAISRKEAAVGKACFAERFIEGREFTACMYGDKIEVRVLDPYEWVFEGFEEQHKAKIITYDAKWNEHSFGFDHIVARYDFPAEERLLLERLAAIARQCWDLFGLSGYARVDFRLDANGMPWVLEVNGNPSFYGFYHCAKKAGIPFESIVARIVEVAADVS